MGQEQEIYRTGSRKRLTRDEMARKRKQTRKKEEEEASDKNQIK
jgi:hypothetical protein